MAVNLSMFAGVGAQLFDNNGVPLSGGKLFTYTAGTTTPQATYTTSAGNVAHANPIILDSAGRVATGGEIWLTNAIDYKFVVKTSADVTIATYDNVSGNGSGVYDDVLARLAQSDGSSLIGFIQSGTGAVARTEQAKLRDTVSVKDFGAVGNNIADDGVAIQAAIDAVFAAGGGTVFFPNGSYISGQTLTLKYRVWLRGVGGRYNENCRIRAAATLNGPLIVSDSVNGPIISTGQDGNPQRLNDSGIENLWLDNASTLSMDCDAIRLTNAWNITLVNCSFKTRKGFAGRIIDCNTLLVEKCFASGGWYCESMADSQFIENQFGPAGFPSLDTDYVSSVMWLSGTQGSGWLSLITNNFIYNAPPGIARSCTVVAGNQDISCPGHEYTDGTPVVYDSTGAFGISGADVTYYVKVVDANTIKVASSRINFNNSVYDTPGLSGSGTQTFRVGGTASLFANDGVQDCVISGNRFDQSYWENIYYRGTFGNTTVGNTVALSGRSNPTPVAGIRVVNCRNENFVGNVIDGLVVGTFPSGTSNQTIGISINAGSTFTTLQGNKYKNHSTASVDNNSTSTLLDFNSIFVNPYQFAIRNGTPALTALTGGRRQAWAMDAASNESLTAYMSLPSGTNSTNKWQIKAFVVNMGAGSGNVFLGAGFQEWADGSNVSGNESFFIGDVVTMPAQDILKVHTFTDKYTPANQALADVTFLRYGADATDTLPNDMGFLGLLFVPT
jgi:hypothetical protein